MHRRIALPLGGLLVLASLVLAIWAYPHAPKLIPSHFDAAGHVNGYMPKFWGLAIWPILLASAWALMAILPSISPKGFRMGPSVEIFNIIMVGVMLIEFVAVVVVVRAAMGIPAPSGGFIIALVGVLFVVIGNYMGKMRKNFFMGIRTPWTLASDEVWLRTHRFGGWLCMLGGIAYIGIGLIEPGAVTGLLAVVAVLLLSPIVYSFIAYKQIEGFGPNGPGELNGL
jgi:uncharacterized membrane protein